MTFVLVVLVLLALVFGASAVLEGIAWALLVSVVIVMAAVWLGWGRLRGVPHGRPRRARRPRQCADDLLPSVHV